MEPNPNADKKESVVPAATTTTEPAPQNALAQELDKVNKKVEGKTKREKLIFTKDRIEKQLSELDAEEGVEPSVESDDDNAPVTVGMLKKIEAGKAVKTALQLADNIADETERALVTHHIKNTIKSTGNPTEDLKHAQAIVNAAKNVQIVQEITRKGEGRNPSGAGAPARIEATFEPTAEEAAMMRAPFNLSKEDVLKARRAAQKE